MLKISCHDKEYSEGYVLLYIDCRNSNLNMFEFLPLNLYSVFSFLSLETSYVLMSEINA